MVVTWLDRNLAIGGATALALAALFLAWLAGLPVLPAWVAPPAEIATARAVSLAVVLPPKRVVPPPELPAEVPREAHIAESKPEVLPLRPRRAVSSAKSLDSAAAAPVASQSQTGTVTVPGPASTATGTGSALGSAAGPGGAAAAGLGDEVVYGASSVDQLPIPLAQPSPVYPDWARRSGQTAVLALRYVVAADGHVRDLQIRVVKGDPRLAEPVKQTVPRWRFKPAQRAGVAVAVRVEQELQFDLDDE